MVRFLSPVALSRLQTLCPWLRRVAPEWNIFLPQDGLVEEGKAYPPLHLYRHDVSVGTVESPRKALEKFGDSRLLQEDERLVSQDPDSSDDSTT